MTRRSVTVEALSLDDYLGTSPDSVDFIKMDIEGAEGHALRGMEELLRRNPHCRLLTEFSPWNLRSCGTDPQDFLQALTDRGFHLYVLDEHDQQISEADTEGLLQLDPHNEDEYTNLFCSPTEWRWDHWLGGWRIGWEERLEMARRELAALATSAEAVIVVDDQAFGDRLGPPDRRPIPFLERDGEYWGPPVDGDHAARELERLREAGAELIVFAWPAFWRLDFYPELESHLRNRYRRVLDNDRLIAYELAPR
ncbi:MAG TPA: FkbM family methyltransferase [Thermoleophilaceae bacterium]|nr:FkbM family methyltransferase [Thermoleophilaceae bacterium]